MEPNLQNPIDLPEQENNSAELTLAQNSTVPPVLPKKSPADTAQAVIIDLNEFDFAPAWVKDLASGKSRQATSATHSINRAAKIPRQVFPASKVQSQNRYLIHQNRHREKLDENSQTGRASVKPEKYTEQLRPQRENQQTAKERSQHNRPNHFNQRHHHFLTIKLIPEPSGTESLARQMTINGRAYPVYDLARMILAKPERYQVVVSKKQNNASSSKNAVEKNHLKEDKKIYHCLIDESIWLSMHNAVDHILEKFGDRFYEKHTEKVDPPKGNFTHMAICGVTGTPLCPPNYHGYQKMLRENYLNAKIRMPFDAYKNKIKIIKDEEILKSWLEKSSLRAFYKPVAACDRNIHDAPAPRHESNQDSPVSPPQHLPEQNDIVGTPTSEQSTEQITIATQSKLQQPSLEQTPEPTTQSQTEETTLPNHSIPSNQSLDVAQQAAQNTNPTEVLYSMEEVRKHFITHHLHNEIKEVDTHVIREISQRANCDPAIHRAIKSEIQRQSVFPGELGFELMLQLRSHGMKFFKIQPNITYVVATSPSPLDITTQSIKDNMRLILRHIQLNPRCNRRQLLFALVPEFEETAYPKTAQKHKESAESTDVSTPHTTTQENEQTTQQETHEHAAQHLQESPQTAEQTAAFRADNTPENPHNEKPAIKAALSILKDLHWLVKAGHVIEYASGELELADHAIQVPLTLHKHVPAQTRKKNHHKHKAHKKTSGRAVEPHPTHRSPVQASPTAAPPHQSQSEPTHAETHPHNPTQQIEAKLLTEHSAQDTSSLVNDPYYDPEFDSQSPIPAHSQQN